MKKWTRARYQPNIPLGGDGNKVTASDAHRSLAREAAKEGMVLLKNEKETLPLHQGTRVALFGKGTFDYVKGGGGSGDVTVSYITNLYDGIKRLHGYIDVYEPLADYYRKDVQRQYAGGAVPGMTVEPEVSEELFDKASGYADTAIISISRFSGEGWDRKSVAESENQNLWEHEDALAKASAKLFEKGDFYLTVSETAMVEAVKERFENVIVVMNVGGMVDSQWFAHDSSIQSVLMAWQGGMEGGNAAAELLCGFGNPSGHLSDTFAKHLDDYPSTSDFHESEHYVNYTEDIYVGYRYFETIDGARDKVNYPFGFGLSYTTFSRNIVSILRDEWQVCIQVDVTNTGNYPGKDVVQVYGEAPMGLLGKAKKSLIGFAKTRELKEGETQRVVIEISLTDLASYDDVGRISASSYVLEQGAYHLYIGSSVSDGDCVENVMELEETTIVEKLERKMAPTQLPKRMLADGTYEALEQQEGNDPNANELVPLTAEEMEGFAPKDVGRSPYQLWKEPFKSGMHTFDEVAEGRISLDAFIEQLKDEELAHLLGGQPNRGVANTFGYGNMAELAIPNIMTADGPAGLRIAPECSVYTTAWPCSTLLACSWNEALVYRVGEAGAKEVKENNIGVWLTPAVNIHRSPLCGRNFEYYSEDPYLTGYMAAAMVKGIQSQHIAATVKHFALNNKETNRKNSDSRVSERAAREIYLKPFEIIVKQARPWSIMTSYNIINGHRASENKELLQGILRDEWGFSGMITTDWWTCGEHYKETLAGNDVKMGCGYPERLLEARDKGLLSREDMAICVKRILELILKID